MKNITVQVVGMSVKELDCILILDGVYYVMDYLSFDAVG